MFTGNGSGHWSLSIERAYLPSVATNVTFQFTQPRGGTTVSRSFAYDPGAGGATSQGPMAPGPSGAVLRQVQFGADVIFSGIAAPGTSVVLLPDSTYTVTSVLMSSQSVPTGVLYGTSINADGTTTYSWYVCTATSRTSPADQTLTVTVRKDLKTGATTYSWPLDLSSNSTGLATADGSGVWLDLAPHLEAGVRPKRNPSCRTCPTLGD